MKTNTITISKLLEGMRIWLSLSFLTKSNTLFSIRGSHLEGTPEMFKDESEVASWWNDEGGANEEIPLKTYIKTKKKKQYGDMKTSREYNSFDKYKRRRGSRSPKCADKLRHSREKAKTLQSTEDVPGDSYPGLLRGGKYGIETDLSDSTS